MIGINIRNVQRKDTECVAAIEAICFPKAEAASGDALAARIAAFPESFLVAEADGEVIGFINGCATDSAVIYDELYYAAKLHRPMGKNLAVFGLDVVPEYQRQGVAAQLMNRFIQLGRKSGHKNIILTCKQQLIHYYEKFGYVNLGISQSTHGGAQWFDMTLQL